MHPVETLAAALDKVVAAGRKLVEDPTQRPEFIAAIDSARTCIAGVDAYLREPLGMRPGEWGTELRQLLRGVVLNAEQTDFSVPAWARSFERSLTAVASEAIRLRDIDISAAGDVAAGDSEPEVLTADEACRFLRLDVLHDGNMVKARAALDRLVDKRMLAPIVYAGPGGGRRMYPRQALRDFVKQQMA